MATFNIIESTLVPENTILVVGSNLMVHPIIRLHMSYPVSPVWCRRTLGHKELERDQRKQEKRNRGIRIYG